jgi:hypothetical protein
MIKNHYPGYIYPTEMEYVFNEYFGKPLEKEGFIKINSKKWIRRKNREIFDIFQIQALKAASYLPIWGFSLCFVPKLSGNKLIYYKSEKDTKLDYRYDPLDYYDNSRRELMISRLHGAEKAKQSGLLSSNKYLPIALSLFSGVKGVPELCQLFEESLQAHRKSRPKRFGFFNYVQFPIAYAYSLAHEGNYNKGAAILQETIKRGFDYGPLLEKILSDMKIISELK